jgi:hypothetical protein
MIRVIAPVDCRNWNAVFLSVSAGFLLGSGRKVGMLFADCRDDVTDVLRPGNISLETFAC